MKVKRQFDINIIKLSDSTHHYEFDIESSFFKEFEDSFLEKGKLKAEVKLEKSSTLIRAGFKISGVVELTCDRSLEPFDYKVDTINNLVIKYGEEYAELTEEIITIPRDLATLNFAQFIYEFIGLAIPIKKLHPKFKTEVDEEEDEIDDEEEGILIYSTISEDEEEGNQDSESENDNIDPRWNILNNLKNNLN